MKAKKPQKVSRKLRIDKKLSLAAYVITLISAVAARTIQLQTNMNFATGKYIDSSLSVNYTTWILTIGFVLILAAMIFGQSRDKVVGSCVLISPMRLRAERLNKKIPIHAGAALLAMAMLMAFDMFMELSKIVEKNSALSTEDNPVFVFSGISAMQWIIYGCSLITLITMVSAGVNILKGEGLSKGNCVFFMFFPIWKLLEIFTMFIEEQLVGVYSEKVYILLTAMTSAMFFLNVARLFGGFEKKNTRFWMCIFGYAASIFAAVSVIPRYIMYFTLNYTEREGMAAPVTSDLGIAFLTIAFVAVFWGTYVYRVMPKLNLSGKRRWNKTNLSAGTMQSIDAE